MMVGLAKKEQSGGSEPEMLPSLRRGWPAAPAWPRPPPASPTVLCRAISRSCRKSSRRRFTGFASSIRNRARSSACPTSAIPAFPRSALDLDIRTDLPRYRVWRDGEVVEEPTDIMAHWRDDLVAFVLGCSFSFEEALMADGPADPPHRAQRSRADVPHQYRLPAVGAVRGADGGVDAAVQAGGCDPRGADHLALSRRAWRAGSSRPSRIRSGSRISQDPTMATPCRSKPTRFRCSGPAASPRRR